VRCYEVGPDQLATMVTTANLLQECAANHAQALWGARTWAPQLMTEQHMAFALSKLHIRLDAPMQWCASVAQRESVSASRVYGGARADALPRCRRGSAVRVRTWFAEAGTLAARRDWTICDAATGARIGAATSTWLAFNLNTRRMARLPPALRTYFQTASPQPTRCVTCARTRSALGSHRTPVHRASRCSLRVSARVTAGRWARTSRRSGAWSCRRTRPAACPRCRACADATWT
jgi:hypothetical protein